MVAVYDPVCCEAVAAMIAQEISESEYRVLATATALADFESVLP